MALKIEYQKWYHFSNLYDPCFFSKWSLKNVGSFYCLILTEFVTILGISDVLFLKNLKKSCILLLKNFRNLRNFFKQFLRITGDLRESQGFQKILKNLTNADILFLKEFLVITGLHVFPFEFCGILVFSKQFLKNVGSVQCLVLKEFITILGTLVFLSLKNFKDSPGPRTFYFWKKRFLRLSKNFEKSHKRR